MVARRELARRIDDEAWTLRAIAAATRAAALHHAASGHDLPIWRDGKVVWLTPEETVQMLEESDSKSHGSP